MPLHMSPFGTHMKWDFHGDHHGGVPWQHMNLSLWTRVWLPNSSNEPDHEILGSGLETSGLVWGQHLVSPHKNLLKQLCVTLHFPQDNLMLSLENSQDNLKLSMEWLCVVGPQATMGVNGCQGPGLQKSSQFRSSSSLVLVNLDLDSKTIPNDLGDLVLTICCGMR
jgi:hypothetical protein